MKKILSSQQMKIYENNTIENIGVDGIVLMERAGLELKNFIKPSFAPSSSILIACGTGNNGADGLCLARLLIEEGYNPHVLINYGHSESDLFRKQKSILEKLNVTFVTDISYSYDLIVDALLGIGIKGMPDLQTIKYIEEINSSDSYILSVDIPSGLTSYAQEIYAVKADTTITFGAYKEDLFIGKAVNYTGQLVLKEIGIFDYDCDHDYLMLENHDLLPVKKTRIQNSNKGTYGKILVFAGSKDMCGCAILTLKACLKTGCGMVKVVTHESNILGLNTSLPEAMVTSYSEISKELLENIDKDINWSDTIVCGPGIGTKKIAVNMVQAALNCDKTLILDADGLNCISEQKYLQELLISRGEKHPYTTVITPHKCESKRLLTAFSFASLKELSEKCKVIIVDKDARSLIIGRKSYINPTGNNGMSTAGSGDVLSGIIASVCGFWDKGLLNCKLEEAVAMGVYIHGSCGDKAIENSYEGSLIASDIIDCIPAFLYEIDK